MTLARKALAVLAVNLLLLGLMLGGFVWWQLRDASSSILLGPVRERVLALAGRYAIDLELTAVEDRAALAQLYSSRNHTEFYLVSPEGEALDGQSITFPPEVTREFRRGGGPPMGVRPPPPPGEEPGEPKGPGEFNRGEFNRGDFKKKGGPKGPRLLPDPVFLVRAGDPLVYWVGARIPVRAPDQPRPNPGILLLRTASLFRAPLFADLRPLWLLLAGVVAVSVACWLPFVRGITRSIQQMDRATSRIAAGEFDVSAVDGRDDEVGHLGAQIDRLAARLSGFVTGQKRFLGDIAHELTAPLARIQFALGILEQRAAPESRTAVEDLNVEIQEMSSLVNELLLFSKAGMSPREASLTAVRLRPLAERVAARDSGSATVMVDVPANLAVLANEVYLMRALSNVVRNAVRYAGDVGPVELTAQRLDQRVEIRVADSGAGLPPDALEHIFEPFYRPEAARQRATGGAGLGLAIVKTCVEACRGSVSCKNRPARGLEVIIELAAAPGSGEKSGTGAA